MPVDLRMPSLNHIMIAGRLTRDPELKYTASEKPFCRFGIAASEYYKGPDGERKEKTVFITCQAWNKTAEFIGRDIKKGDPVIVEGSLNCYESTDRETGAKSQRIEITAQRVQPISWKEDGGAPRQAPPPRPAEKKEAPPLPEPENDLPF